MLDGRESMGCFEGQWGNSGVSMWLKELLPVRLQWKGKGGWKRRSLGMTPSFGTSCPKDQNLQKVLELGKICLMLMTWF